MPHTSTFKYLDHHGEITERQVNVVSIDFVQNPGFNYQPGWFISGHDQSKGGAWRSFALARIVTNDDENPMPKIFSLVL